MNPYLKVSGLEPAVCARLLGYNPRHFQEWAAGQSPIPSSVVAHIAAVLGVDAEDLLAPRHQLLDETAIEPAVWFKLRSQGLGSADRELVLLVRQLGTFYEELEQVRAEASSRWRIVFENTRQEINAQASPREQGQVAAQIIRGLLGWNTGRNGIGSILRGSLRSLGILIVESPIIDSKIEGCAFPVGANQRPCIFVNTHNTTWFRRNAIILHELAHLIFDLGSEGATLDIFDATDSRDGLSERRAEAFAQETAIPTEVLSHIAQKYGISWRSPLGADSLARLVAESHVELRLIIKAAIENGLLDKSAGESLTQIPIHDRLKDLSDHALSTREYLGKVGKASEEWISKRTTTIPSRRLLLPVNYVKSVVDTCREGLISIGRAARLLMIGEDVLVERFNMTWLLDEE